MSTLLLFKGVGTGPTIVEGEGASSGSSAGASVGATLFTGVSTAAGVASGAMAGAARWLGTAAASGVATVLGIAPQAPTEAEASASGAADVAASGAWVFTTTGSGIGLAALAGVGGLLAAADALCAGLSTVLGESDSTATIPMGRMRRRFAG